MKYLILGSSGQIGQHLCNILKKQNKEVIEFDINNDQSQDLRIPNNQLLELAIQRCDKIFFLAFDCGGSKYLKDAQQTKQFIDNNMKILLYTFDVISRYNKPFIFVSSQMSNNLNSSYGALKLVGEHYTKSLNGVIVKLWNVYGNENANQKIMSLLISSKVQKKIII